MPAESLYIVHCLVSLDKVDFHQVLCSVLYVYARTSHAPYYRTQNTI